MEQLAAAVEVGRAGDRGAARVQLESLWAEAGDDPFGRCTVAHYLADLQETTQDELRWDLRALEASEELTGGHAGLQVEAFLPSLHLNLADDYRRLSRTDEARHHLRLARERLAVLGQDAYGDLIRGAVDRVGEALDAGSTEPLPTNPSTVG
jgi:hypothetical protein